eukprot:994704_1
MDTNWESFGCRALNNAISVLGSEGSRKNSMYQRSQRLEKMLSQKIPLIDVMLTGEGMATPKLSRAQMNLLQVMNGLKPALIMYKNVRNSWATTQNSVVVVPDPIPEKIAVRKIAKFRNRRGKRNTRNWRDSAHSKRSESLKGVKSVDSVQKSVLIQPKSPSTSQKSVSVSTIGVYAGTCQSQETQLDTNTSQNNGDVDCAPKQNSQVSETHHTNDSPKESSVVEQKAAVVEQKDTVVKHKATVVEDMTTAVQNHAKPVISVVNHASASVSPQSTPLKCRACQNESDDCESGAQKQNSENVCHLCNLVKSEQKSMQQRIVRVEEIVKMILKSELNQPKQ